jgi:ketosteroid isomerase-like protein
MSQENVEIVRRIQDAFLHGKYEAMFELIADGVEWDDARFPGGARLRGHQGMAKASGRWFGAWDEYEVEFLRNLDAGEKVVSFFRQRGRGKGSGATVEMEAAQVWTLRKGLAVKLELFPEQAEALEAAGLSE